MKASVIIPAHNAGATLPACLAALARQTASERLREIIVADDGSTDATPAVAAAAGATVLSQPCRGAAAARNLGAQHAAGDILLFTDADCEPAEDWVAAMLEPFADPTVAGVKGVYRTRQTALTARFVQLEYADKYRRMARRPEIDFIDTYSAGYRRDVFLAAGGFDESYPRANVEDQEFSFRLAAAGHKMLFQPRAVVGHRHAATLRAYIRKKFWIGYWKVKVHLRHPGKALSDSHTPPVLKAQIGLLALTLGLGAAGSVWAGAWLGALAALLILLGSMLPFVAWAWGRDRAAALAAPAFLLARAGALGIGLAAGIAAQIGRRK
jgi:glycosyltransferase involved in cell wall biosynthesis